MKAKRAEANKSEILYVGVDVDDKAFHIAGLSVTTGELLEYTCKPTHGALVERLKKMEEKGYQVKVCYEATYLGYSLCRQLKASGYDCEIIAPSLIPVQKSVRVKTDKIDSRKLAEYYGKGLLTKIHVPDEQDEQLRRLIRTRGFHVQLRKMLKQHILSTCRVLGLQYRSGEKSEAEYWTKIHQQWLLDQTKELNEIDSWSLEKMLHDLIHADQLISQYDQKIEEMSQTEKYKVRSLGLTAFKGIKTLSAMTLISEIGDIQRFGHPSKLVSYAGMDIVEYSSGGKEKKFGMTKAGNRHIRTAVIEACQSIKSGTTISKQLRNRRKEIPTEIVDIAERCQNRLYKKKTKMTYNHKHANVIKSACAREMLCFIWEALQKVA